MTSRDAEPNDRPGRGPANAPERQPVDPKVDHSLNHSLRDAGAYAVMIGIGETYLSAFALHLRATTPQIGLLASVPPLLASVVQLVSAWIGGLTGRRRSIMLIGAGIQAFAWLPIALLPLALSSASVPLLIASVVLYYCGANLAAPQWGSLMGDIVPVRRRGRFFALRTRIVSLVTFVALIGGGLILQAASSRNATFAGFLVLFGIAFIARLISIWHLAQMHDPKRVVVARKVPDGKHWWDRLRHSNFVRFSVFFALMQCAVAVASPFFTVYMLRDLEFSYAAFMANTGTAILAQFLTLNRWGRISDVFGNRRILATAGLLIPLMPLLWILSGNFWYLLFVQLLSGLSWAGFTLSAGNFLYDLVPPERRTTYLAVHNVLASIGIFAGAMLGGYLGAVLPVRVDVLGAALTWSSPLLGVFAVSAVLRATVMLVLMPKIREVRRVRHASFADLIFRVTRVNALAGLFFDIIGPKSGPASRSNTPERKP
ncbi:MAG: MFS transporter [Woeseiaceae bacterium]|nr:MFS transporter [Woeseiaceae bacterium]